MPRTQREPADGLFYPGKGDIRRATRPGGRDTAAVGDRLLRKTYVLDRDQVERIAGYARTRGVGINELVRWLLAAGLDALEAGTWELPIETVEVKHIAAEHA